MKKLLLLSYYFPPLGMGGTQRPAKFARYLPEFGWEATVLTVKPIAYWANDPSLLEDVAGVAVVRTGSLDPQRLLMLISRRRTGNGAAMTASASSGLFAWINQKIVPWFLLPDSKILWRWHAGRAASRLLRTGEFDAILTTSPPHSVHLIGLRLARRFNLPWVADFRDAWAGSVVVHEPTRWHRRCQHQLQRRVVRAASAVIGVTPGIVAGLEAAGAAGKAIFIPNGFDAADFPGFGAAAPAAQTRPHAQTLAQKDQPAAALTSAVKAPCAAPAAAASRFTLCHCGSISRFSNPAPLLAALTPEDGRTLRVLFVGYDANGQFEEHVRDRGLEEVIEYAGYQPHRLALAAMSAADALVLIACDQPGARFIPGKTFEYLASLKPVLLISNVSETIRLLDKIPGLLICGPEQPEAIRAALQRLQTDAALRQAAMKRDLLPFERKHQTRQLAGVLDRLSARSGS